MAAVQFGAEMVKRSESCKIWQLCRNIYSLERYKYAIKAKTEIKTAEKQTDGNEIT